MSHKEFNAAKGSPVVKTVEMEIGILFVDLRAAHDFQLMLTIRRKTLWDRADDVT